MSLKCDQPAAKEIYAHLITLDQSGAFPQGLNLDSGYQKLNYRDSSKPKVTVEGKEDGGVSCEETWENGLQALDTLGGLAKWEEDPAETNDPKAKHAIERYQEFRKLIERNTRRPVSYVLEAPHHETYLGERVKRLKEAKEIRNKTNLTIQKLNELMEKEKLNPTQRQRCLIACLYWFVLVNKSGKGTPHKLVSFLKKQGLSKENINKIKGEFSKYLQNNNGGLGLDDVEDDAKFEATALETVLEKRGLCTEQSKVMYAVLRMAGIKAFFVEPKISVEYAKAKDIQPNPPLPSHMATGIGIKIFDENNVEQVWIIDLALGLLEADYIEDDKDSRWKAHPYWILSLRHFLMVDLSNLGVTQQNNKQDPQRFEKAEDSFKPALNLGEDSTAYFAMGNYPDLIQERAKNFSPGSSVFQKAKSLMERSTIIYPYSAKTHLDKGWYLAQEYKWQEAFTAFLQSIKVDPRYGAAYRNAAVILYELHGLRPYKKSRFRESWGLFKTEMRKLIKNHLFLREDIKDQLQKMTRGLHQFNDRDAGEVIKFINNFCIELFKK